MKEDSRTAGLPREPFAGGAGRRRFSVAMATYNGGSHLREQLDSIAAQTLLPIELQIGDDGSTDDTPEIVQAFAERAPFPVHFHRNARNLGYAQNFIEAARRCSGDWIAFSDQDDVWRPHKLARCSEALDAERDDEIVMIAHRADVVGDDLAPTGRFIPEEALSGVKGPLSHELIWSHYGFAQLFRRDLLSQIEPSPRVPTVFLNIDRYPHDVWISVLANVLGRTLHMPDALGLYRRHQSSVTQTAKADTGFSLASLLSTGSAHYRHVAGICREAADSLGHHADRVSAPSWAVRLKAGEAAYRAAALAYDRRASLYDAERLTGRLRAIGGLASGRGYFGLGASSFGFRALMKDLAVALLPFLFKPRQAVSAGARP